MRPVEAVQRIEGASRKTCMTSWRGNLTDPRLIWLKGGLFLLAGLSACCGLLLEAPSWRVAFFLAIAVWCAARFYYFAFSVIEHYVDSTYRFAGLWDFAKYALWRRRPNCGRADATGRSLPDGTGPGGMGG